MSERKVSCPRCGKPALFSSANPSRPFCSERCKLIDLGNWADERYAIPVAPAPGSAAAEDLDEIDAASNDSDENDSGPEDDSHGFNPQL